ncbi:MAG TPA: FtsK/SpoIIIE domain-containing protein [Solirubrobacteraceae bacterium]|nr:FtsK/SpoIIIE domain-containing protein [Solirubrobacteraceae bacterium]
MLDNHGDGIADLELRLGREDATVGDLLDALPGASGARGILIDGRFCHIDLALHEIGLYEGALIRPADGPPGDEEPAAAALELRVVAGFDAGRQVPLGPRPLIVGRDPECDVSLADEGVSRRHFRVQASPSGLRATLTDLESVNGTWAEGRRIREPVDVAPGTLFEAGDVAFTLVPYAPGLPVDPVRQANIAGTIPFNRPPRSLEPRRESPLTVPEEPREQQKPRFSWASAFAPLVLAGAMVLFLHNLFFAIFGLLSPVMVVSNYWEQRRQTRSSSRGDQREFERKMDSFRQELATRQADELTRRRGDFPDMAEIIRRAIAPDPRLWERRPEHDDFLTLSAGYGELPYRPSLVDHHSAIAEPAEAALAERGSLALAPVPVKLNGGGVVGIVGERAQALALARALLCQAAVLHGPADVIMAVFTEQPAREDWDFVKWLPHARDASGASGRQLAVGTAAGASLAAELAERDEDDPRTVLAVLDSPVLIEGRGAPGRALLRSGEKLSGIVLARSTERLPAACTTVIELADEAGEARLSRPQTGERVDPLLVAGISVQTARECAVALARFEDADLQLIGGALPNFVSLLGLMGMGAPSGEELRARWRRSSGQTSLEATFALSEDGPLDIDLVADGPHGLVAGTTGAGKSELLRSLVASLAVRHPPTRVNFVLIDYKGGSAFGECAELPHTVGMVTDLDEHLGERALRSLEAELRYRERVLREHRASDVIEHDKLVAEGHAEPLPRLLVVIDEFATLAAELPDFVPSLVGIAQRGRSLGVHMILATQRPSGAVNENIRANTNLRVCLRVQAPQDSSDVIDSPAAAKIPRQAPGRAYMRLGPAELVPVQAALVSGDSASGPSAAITMAPFTLPSDGAVATATPDAEPRGGRSDLQKLVAATAQAFEGGAPPRRPWLEPLPAEVSLDSLRPLGPARPMAGERGTIVPLGLADDPDAQLQYPVGWNLTAGNLLLFGIGGSGTTTTLATIALTLAASSDPERLHMYVLDFGAGELAPLAGLPQVGAVIGTSEHERQRRLLQRLRGELQARRGLDPAARAQAPRIVLLLDGFAAFTSEHNDLEGDALRDAVARIWADGPELGIHMAIAADRLGAVPLALASLAQQRLAFQLADAADYSQFGLARRAIPKFVPGRAVVGGSAQLIQVARAAGPLRERVAERVTEDTSHGGPPPIGVLPESVGIEVLLGAARAERDPLFIPLGIGDETLEPEGVALYEGDHALIAGPPRTGRTTALRLVAEVVAALYPDIELIGVALRRSPLRDHPALARVVTAGDELPELVAGLKTSGHPQVLLIDDADSVDDSARALGDLFGAALPRLHAVVAGRGDALRSLGHWTVGVRRSRTGLLLQPDVQVDGQLLGVTLPRRPAPPVRPGCGYRVDPGGFGLMQVAQPRT